MGRRRRSSPITASSSPFDKICRRNGIAHRLTQPASPTTTGKIERFPQTLRRELLDDARPFIGLLEAQAALDDWVREYNAIRPHQALATRKPVTPSERFRAASDEQRELLGLWLPAALQSAPDPAPSTPTVQRAIDAGAAAGVVESGPIEVDRVIPASGNLWFARRQFWLGPARAGQVVRVWAGVNVIHLSIAAVRVKSLRSHLSPADLTALVHAGAMPAGPPPLPEPDNVGDAVEVERIVSNSGIVVAGSPPGASRRERARPARGDPRRARHPDVLRPRHRRAAADPPNPVTAEEIRGLQGARPAGPPPRPRTEPVTVQRRVSATGVICVCRQAVALGRIHAGRTVAVHVSEHTLAIELDQDTRTVRRTTTHPVRVVKGSRRHDPVASDAL